MKTLLLYVHSAVIHWPVIMCQREGGREGTVSQLTHVPTGGIYIKIIHLGEHIGVTSNCLLC